MPRNRQKSSRPLPRPAEPTQDSGASAQPPQPPSASSTAGGQTLQQERARYALEKVKTALGQNVNCKEFRSYASSFPAMVQMNGLGQAAAFYFSQGKTHLRLYNILSDWLIGAEQPYEGKANLLDGITNRDMHEYRVAQAEALLLLDWVKKFAKAYMRED